MTPALRDFVLSGAIDGPGLQEELVHSFFGQTHQVQSWIGPLGEYCMQRADRGPLEDWRPDIDREDLAEAQRLRCERIMAEADALFQMVSPIQRVPNAGRPGWHGLVRHEDRPGGWIVSEDVGGPGVRRVWETDSDAELETAYVRIVEAQRQWIIETFGGRARATDGLDGQ